MSGDFELPPGTVLGGKYRVDRVLGRGGMGVVLAARHLQLDQAFALKVMLPEYSRHPEAVARFLREARAAVRVRDEHVAQVTDVGETDRGVPFMVMELLEGSDVESLLTSRGPLPIDETVDLVLQACAGVAEAHALGIVHRDLKPSNLFVTRRRDGSALVKVLDFGISKALDQGDGSLTATSAMIGSPLYMSPEQIRAAKDVDGRTDVWSLGAVLYELLTGVAPFVADSASAVLARVVADEPAPLRGFRPELPEALEGVVLSCLRKNRDERPASVEALMQALLPFAPSASAVLAARGSRAVAGGPNGTDLRHASGTTAEPADAGVSAFGRPSRRTLVVAALGAVLAIALASAWLLGGRHEGDGASEPVTTIPARPLPVAAANPPSDPKATSATQEPSAEPRAEATQRAPTIREAVRRVGVPRKPTEQTPPPRKQPEPKPRGDDLFADPK